VEAELVCDLGGVHGILNLRLACDSGCQTNWRICCSDKGTHRQILLVGEDEEDGITELILVEHALEFLASLDDTVTIVAVDDEDDTLGVLEVMSPERANLVLTTNIPHCELDVLVLDGLDVEA
jgi:hypothetical protein